MSRTVDKWYVSMETEQHRYSTSNNNHNVSTIYIVHINYQTSSNSQNSKKKYSNSICWHLIFVWHCHISVSHWRKKSPLLSVYAHRTAIYGVVTAGGMATHLKVGHWALPRNTVNDSAYDATSTVFPIHPSPTKSLYWTFSTSNYIIKIWNVKINWIWHTCLICTTVSIHFTFSQTHQVLPREFMSRLKYARNKIRCQHLSWSIWTLYDYCLVDHVPTFIITLCRHIKY